MKLALETLAGDWTEWKTNCHECDFSEFIPVKSLERRSIAHRRFFIAGHYPRRHCSIQEESRRIGSPQFRFVLRRQHIAVSIAA
jgi:hypothetical protein